VTATHEDRHLLWSLMATLTVWLMPLVGAVVVAERLLLVVKLALGAWPATLATLPVASPLFLRMQVVAFPVAIALVRRSSAPIQPYRLREFHRP